MGGKMLESIIAQLQWEALNSSSSISDLLRKAFLVSRKLKIEEFQQWINQELNGYNCPPKDIPKYREIVGKLVFYNPYRGWIPAVISDHETSDLVSRHRLSQSITELLELVNGDKGHGFQVQLNRHQQNLLSDLFKNDLVDFGLNDSSQFGLNFGKSQIQGIIDTVRNTLLDWTLRLEEDYVSGEVLSLRVREKQEVAAKDPIKQEFIFNFHGNTSGVQFLQNSPNSIQTMTNQIDLEQVSDFISKIKENLTKLELPQSQQNVVESAVEAISHEIESPQPKHAAVKQSLLSIKTMLEGAVGNLVASGVLYELGKIHF